MSNLENAIRMAFVAKAALANLEALECPDEIMAIYVCEANENVIYIFDRLAEMMPISEVSKLLTRSK